MFPVLCMLTVRYKNKLCLVNLLFVHCNDKKDKVERTINDRKCSSTTIFCDCLKKKKKKGKLFARLTSNQIQKIISIIRLFNANVMMSKKKVFKGSLPCFPNTEVICQIKQLYTRKRTKVFMSVCFRLTTSPIILEVQYTRHTEVWFC